MSMKINAWFSSRAKGTRYQYFVILYVHFICILQIFL
ncbi:hypothetical protein DESC_300078 [Desulfosarcina cetonica]|nr:hypothetical protein DESC_300078 [Desulfosarcina cetonica]